MEKELWEDHDWDGNTISEGTPCCS